MCGRGAEDGDAEEAKAASASPGLRAAVGCYYGLVKSLMRKMHEAQWIFLFCSVIQIFIRRRTSKPLLFLNELINYHSECLQYESDIPTNKTM